MRKLILSLILSLSMLASATAQPATPGGLAGYLNSIFAAFYEDANGDIRGGTTFCVPGRVNQLVTASHVAGDGVWVRNMETGDELTVRVLARDEKRDVAVLQVLDKAICELSPLQWARANARMGEKAWLVGYGGLLLKPILTVGVISSQVGAARNKPQHQAAQLNALFGHSGSPVMNEQGKIVGMLVGGFNEGDEMDLIVPIEEIRKVVK